MYVAKIPNLKIYRVNSLITSDSQQSLFNSQNGDSIMTIEDYLRLNKVESKVDLILTNPPFAGEVNEKYLLDNYEVAKNRRKIERDILFIERCIDLLKPNGRMVIILPDNVFGSRDNIYLREWIHSKAKIIGVIGLPRNTFMPHTPVKTSILLLKKRSPKTNINEEIFFGISEQAGKDSRGNLKYLKDETNTSKQVAHDLDVIEKEFTKFISEDKELWI
jgi:type I restriction enzyme M protein